MFINNLEDCESNVYEQVSELTNLFLDIWWSTKADFHILHPKTCYWHKKNQEKETDKFINKLFNVLEEIPSDEGNRESHKQKIFEIIDDFSNKSDLLNKKHKEILLKDDLIEATLSFVNEVKGFDQDMMDEDIGQAMRNVWIMNIIQLLFNKKPQLTSSVFAYSMLYPYTDNYLDDLKITTEEKNKINSIFEKRLSGEKLKPSNVYEKRLFKLVDKIEEQYKRKDYPYVYESLLSIHYAQGKSLKQQDESDFISGPYEKDVLGISIEKGGTSVLADAYLVNGTLTDKEAAFFFGYGVLLQLCDDLQDCEKDYQGKHSTIMSQLCKNWCLDNVTNKLINFTYALMEDIDYFDCENKSEIKSLISKNCINLILFAAAKNNKMYSRKYIKEVEKHLPFTIRYMNTLSNKLKKKYNGSHMSYELFMKNT